MSRIVHRVRRGAFAAAVTLALGFGATQATAVPAAAPAEQDGPRCNPKLCDRLCRAIGAFSGTCTPSGGCACAL